jgi:DNA-binding winged helix-turn-helix (wHTH) protein
MVRGDRSVDVFVRKLRQKLERVSPDWRYIHTHFGIGYRFAAEPAEPAGQPGAADHSGLPVSSALELEILESEPSNELDLARA